MNIFRAFNIGSLLYFSILIALTSCQTLTFTNDQFNGTPSNAYIPEDWTGDWGYVDSEYFFIHTDSIYINGFKYKFEPEKLDTIDAMVQYTEEEDFEENPPKDKIIFHDNWCFLEVYMPDSSERLCGYRLLMAKKESNGDISCWNVGYSYMLKHQLISAIPAIRQTYSKSSSKMEEMEGVLTLIQLPEQDKLSRHKYRRIIRQLTITPEISPLISEGIFDIDFFEKYARKNKADVVLKADRTCTSRNKSRLEKKYERWAKKSAVKDLIRTIETDF